MGMPVTDQEVEKARNHLTAWLRYHMGSEGLDQQGLAERLGVSKGLITQWFKATGTKGLPNFASLLAISKEVDVGLDVLTRKNPPATRS